MTVPKLHRTTERILDILELIAQNKEGMTFTSIANSMQMPKSSLHPLLHTLNHRRYIHYKEDVQRYYMGESLFMLGQLYAQNVNIIGLIQKEVTTLSNKLNETSFFGVLSGTDIAYLAKGEPNIPIRIVTAFVGTKNPAHSTGLGKAILMSYTKEQLKAILPDTLVAKTPHTITSLDVLYHDLQIMKKEGFAYEKEESTPGIQCVSVPICYDNAPVAALSVSVPVYRFSIETKENAKIELTEAKQRIEEIIMLYYNEWHKLYSG